MSREPHPGRPNVPTRALCIAIPHDRGDESFADDLNMGRGIVSGRVALLLRSTEIPPHRPNDLLPPFPPPTPGSPNSLSLSAQHLPKMPPTLRKKCLQHSSRHGTRNGTPTLGQNGTPTVGLVLGLAVVGLHATVGLVMAQSRYGTPGCP